MTHRIRLLALGIVLFFPGVGFSAAIPFEQLLLQNDDERGSPESVLLAVVSDFMSDNERKDAEKKETFVISGREKEASEVLDILVRMKGAVPVLIGGAGVGKTATVSRAVQKTVTEKYPDHPAFRGVLEGAEWIQTSPGRIMKLVKTNNPAGRMQAIETLFEAVLQIEKKYNKKIILYIDEIHSLDSEQVEAMLPYLDSKRKNIRLVGSTNADKYQNAFKDNSAWMRRTHLIGLEELDLKAVIPIVKKWWVPQFEARYRVKLNPRAIEAAVRVAPYLVPEAGRFDASIKTLEDLCINRVRRQELNPNLYKGEIDEDEVYKFFTRRTGYPVNPHDSKAMTKYISELKESLSSEIIDQPRMVDDLTRLYQAVMLGSKKGVGVAVIVGPTGTGKSELGLMLAKYGFKREAALLRVDANEYKTGGLSMNKLFGAEGGLVTSDVRSGVMCDFFDDPSRGKYGGVVLIDEGERAHPDFWERLMEFLDTGSFVGGDGKRRNARRHLVVITSNRGDRVLFPERSNQWNEREMRAHVETITTDGLKRLFQRKISGKDNYQLPTPILNRVDVFTVSQPLTSETVTKVALKTVRQFVNETKEEFHIDIHINERVTEYLSLLDYNLQHGARPIITRVSQVLQDARTQALANLNLPRGSVLNIEIREKNDGTPILSLVQDGTQNGTEVSLPKQRVSDPLKDPEMREILRTLPEKMAKNLIGQEDAIQSVSRAAIAHLGSQMGNRRPLSLFLIGLTGVGKTEMAKRLAEAVYGSTDRAEVVPLGHITHEAHLTKIFGSEPGYIGSDQERSFEDALRNNPQGGVIVFDEASNMGAGDKGLKEMFFKKFYDLLDEGKWTSPNTAVTYDLGKYIFLWTGNDGEDLFRGVQSDDIRLSIWEKNKSRERVREILLETGVPPAFLGRQADTILMKPLLRTEVENIARDRLAPVIEAFRARGVEVTYDKDFARKFAASFFSGDTGARSLRNVAEHRIRGLLTEALLKLDFDPAKPFPYVLHLGLSDNSHSRPYLLTYDEERKLLFTVSAIEKGAQVAGVQMDGAPAPRRRKPAAKVIVNEDLTEFTDEVRLLPIRQAVKTSYHEAGHAVMNDPQVTGQRLEHLTIRGGKGYLGYARYEDLRNQVGVYDRASVLSQMARLLAGQMAMVMAGFPPDSGWSSDLSKARSLATRFLKDWGLEKNYEGVMVNSNGKAELSDMQKEEVAKAVGDMIAEAKELAFQTLSERWPLVREVVRRLVKNGSLLGDEFDELGKRFELGALDNRDQIRERRVAKCKGFLERLVNH